MSQPPALGRLLLDNAIVLSKTPVSAGGSACTRPRRAATASSRCQADAACIDCPHEAAAGPDLPRRIRTVFLYG